MSDPFERTDEPGRRLLSAIQSAVPLEARPYRRLGQDVGLDEGDVIDRVRRWRRDGVLREISAIFDVVALGYVQTLAAFRVPDGELDRAGRVLAEHPGVSHAYARQAEYNLWFTVAVSPRSRLGLGGTIDVLARRAGAESTLVCPALRRYKLRVRFEPHGQGSMRADDADEGAAPDAAGGAADGPREDGSGDAPATPGEREVRAIRALQRDLPGSREAFAPLAAGAETSVGDLLAAAGRFLARGWMRRYAAVLHHRRAGAEANVMVAWRVASEADADRAGALCASVREVSHCYLRPTSDDWPWGFYTMVHGRDEAACREAVERIASSAPLGEHRLLWTRGEYVKRRVELFSQAEARWEGANG